MIRTENRTGASAGKRRNRLLLLMLALAIILAVFTGSASAAGWEQFEQPAAVGVKASPFLLYSVYTPDGVKPGLPLVIYLHSSDGISWTAMGSQIDLPMFIADGTVADPQAVILVPQLTRDHNLTWANVINSVNTIVETVIDRYEVDTSRISLTGFSLGGIGIWELASLAPERYARMLCIGGRANAGIDPAAFAGRGEIRVFSSTGDLRSNRIRSEEFVNALLDAGASASFELLSLQHTEAPRLVYGDPDIQKWLWLIPDESAEESAEGSTAETAETDAAENAEKDTAGETAETAENSAAETAASE